MYKEDLALNKQQGLICHKTIPNQPLNKNDWKYQTLYLSPDISISASRIESHLTLKKKYIFKKTMNKKKWNLQKSIKILEIA